jgi:hypothetical protein
VSRETVGLDPGAGTWVDVVEFRQLLQTWETHGHPQDEVCPDCLSDLTAAVDLYRGDLLRLFPAR